MKRFLEYLDDLAGTSRAWSLVRWLERIAFVFLILMIVSAPHSIAATQTAWIIGTIVWLASLAVTLPSRRRSRQRLADDVRAGRPHDSRRDAGVTVHAGVTLHFALWAFFIWSAVTSIFSYDPLTSIDKLRGTIVFLIFYFVLYNVRNLRAVHFAAFALIVSCMVNVIWTPVQRLIGRGVEIHGLSPVGPLAKALLLDGDALLEANGEKLTTPERLAAAVEQNEVTKVKFYRPDFVFTVDVKRSDLLPGSNSLERLGFESWKKSRNWRSSGFYGHYTTYAEVIQLIASLVFGLLIAAFANRKNRLTVQKLAPRHLFSSSLLLAACLAAMMLALLLTVTRASQLAFLVSAAAIVFVGLGRKWLLAAAAVGLPIVLIGLFFLQQSREVGFFDQSDDSIKWRQTVWREGFELWTENPRHFLVGVGMDSIKQYAKEWRLFDDGRLDIGHFHSTPLQLVVERGLPALIIWLIILGVYARTLWRALRRGESRHGDTETRRHGNEILSSDLPVAPSPFLLNSSSWVSNGILLGCFGGTIGFFASGLVHYNLGDQEVAMVFFLLMGLGMKVVVLTGQNRER